MTHSEQVGQIATALAKAQGQIAGAPKDSTNPHFNSRYADLASIVEACKQPLAANDIAVVQSPSADGNLVRMTTLLVHKSGEWIASAVLQVQARDANPQAIGSCLTYLRRYQLAAMVGVAPEDDDAELAEGRSKGGVATHPAQNPFTDVDIRSLDRINPLTTKAGFAYIDGLREDGDWLQVTWGRDAQGGAAVYKTKIPKIALKAKQAYRDREPVHLVSKKYPYLDDVERLKNDVPTEPTYVADEAPF